MVLFRFGTTAQAVDIEDRRPLALLAGVEHGDSRLRRWCYLTRHSLSEAHRQ